MVVSDKYFTYHGHAVYFYYHSYQTFSGYFDFALSKCNQNKNHFTGL